MAVTIALGAHVDIGTPHVLFTPGGPYAPSRDGQRFLVSVPADSEGAAAAPTTAPITVVLNWMTGIEK